MKIWIIIRRIAIDLTSISIYGKKTSENARQIKILQDELASIKASQSYTGYNFEAIYREAKLRERLDTMNKTMIVDDLGTDDGKDATIQ